MKAGLLLLGHDPLERLAGLARLAEAAGFDHLWLADERFFREVYSSLAVCAAHTRAIALGPCVTDPYSRHPALTAMAIATLDELSGGRAVLSIGAGISGFAELGIRRERPARALREAIMLVRRLLAGKTVDLAGDKAPWLLASMAILDKRNRPVFQATLSPWLAVDLPSKDGPDRTAIKVGLAITGVF